MRLGNHRRVGGPPNEMQISCRPSSSRPHTSTLPLFSLEERRARWVLRLTPACRLHLRVRQLALTWPH